MLWLWFIISAALSRSGMCDYIPRNLGPMHVDGHYGVLTPKYVPMASIDVQASANLGYFLKQFRNFFETGLGDIPPLDPYYNPKSSPSHINDDDIQGIINFSHFLLVGTKQFSINKIEVRFESGRVDFSLDFPVLTMHVDFTADLTVDDLRNYVTGHANITLNNVRLTAALEVEGNPPGNHTQDQKLTVVAFEYYISTSNAQYNLKDGSLLQEKAANAVRRRFRRSIKGTSSLLVKAIALAVADKVSYATAVAIVNEVNDVLSYYNRAQILAMLLPDSKFYTD